MIHAICLKCGAGKVGAMAACPRCTFVPQKTDDKAKSVLLSDRCAKMPALQKIGQRIARGEKLKFVDAAPKPVVKYGGLTVKQWRFLGLAIGAGIAFGFCLAGVMLLA